MENQEANRIAVLEADNARLRRLLEQRDAPAELRHRLNGTLALLRVVIRRSAETPRSLEAFAAHLEDRLDAIARAQAAADEHGAVELHRLLADEFHVYRAHEGHGLTISGPDIWFRPKAGQTLALAIHELAVNALEHGALESGHVDVTWEVDRSGGIPRLTFSWTERMPSELVDVGPPGFGTLLITEVLRRELKAETELTFAASGLRCIISFDLSERVAVSVQG